MRILVVTPWFPSASMPASGIFVEREVWALAGAHDVHVLHLDWQHTSGRETSATGSLRVTRLPLSRSRPIDFVRARRAVRAAAQHADVVHTHAVTGLIPWRWPRSRPAALPWVHSEHWSGITSPETLSRGARIARRALLPLLRHPDVVVAESGRLASAIRAVRSTPVEIVPCVVPEPDVTEAPSTPPIRLVGVGAMIARKGPLLAAQTLEELGRRGHDATLTWVGDGPQRAAVEEFARTAGLSPRVRLTGTLDQRGVSAELQAANVFLLPTQGDNFCVVAAEALLNGRPVVSGAATGAVDYARPEVSAFVSDQSAGAYADAVESVLASTASLSARDIADTVTGRFTPGAVRGALDAVYATARSLR
ncbi:glycosyltransferase [Microbacterium sp.]|uniref:glycosyltransferase n=1 Tax=Microbacterium sp. TaxID=51671 RepID=UPI002CAE7437|nr:glycosyltransferase [Microbacterium sp.]HWL77211.1 glycosyltransferase [Microbacterium sp.]